MKICMGCMGQYKDEYNICPHCGFFEGTRAAEAMHMDPGSIISDRYIVGKVVGFGGFGVTYIGWDAKLERKIAIKEYLPGEFSTRVPGHTQVTIFSDSTKVDQFNTAMKKFVDEARSLAQFQNEDGIVKVYDTFEENNTAYIIMEFLEGETLTEYLKREDTIPADQAIEMLIPIVRSLKTIHENGIIHRDIAPDNIHIGSNGKIKLIDFGAARYATTNHSRSLTVIIKPGYSPEEQYRSRGDQGPWTDAYAIGAVLYRMITGVTPPDAMERRAMFEKHGKDMLSPIEKLVKDIPENRAIAITNALNVRIENRTADMEELEEELTTDEEVERKEGRIGKIDILKAPIQVKIGIGFAATAVAMLFVLLVTGVINFGPALGRDIRIMEGMTRVPSIINVEIDKAEERIAEQELLYAVVGKEYSTNVIEDMVLTQDIMAGSVVLMNSMVSSVISAGMETQIVNDVIGEDIESVRLVLEQFGFNIRVEQMYSGEFAMGAVIEQNPAGGEEFAIGETITMLVSMGLDPANQSKRVAAAVPNLTGLSYMQAKDLLVQNGFLFKVSSRQFSDSIPESQVISQAIAAGTSAMTGDVIEVVVSKGVYSAIMPDFQFSHIDNVKARLLDLQLGHKITYEESDTVFVDHIISQSIRPKAKIKAGDVVEFVVSKGGKPVEVPDASKGNPKLQDARTLLNAAGFAVDVSYEQSDSIPEGCVIRQSINPGAEARRGEAITLIVSSGKDKQTVALPNIVGRSQASAKSTLEKAGFKVSVSVLESETVAEGNVIYQSPTGGSKQIAGSTVYITVSKGKQAVVVPDVKGKSQSMAEKMLREVGLNPVVTTTYTKEEEKDKVTAQSPRSGASAKAGETVTITVSLGANNGQMPNVIGQSQATAESAINALKLNLVINVTQEFSDTIPAGSVVKQEPWAGVSVKSGDAVTIAISKGGEQQAVPNIVGMSEASAQSQLNASGFRVGSVSQEYSNSVEIGRVISQSPSSGMVANKGDSISYVVSKGGELIDVPKLSGYQIDDAKNRFSDFTIVEIDRAYHDTIADGFIISQSVQAGSKAEKGRRIEVVVSKGKEPMEVPDVRNKSRTQAESELRAKGFQVTVEDGTDMTVAVGNVISQVPAGKILAPKGSTVRIIVCVGKPQVTVPTVKNMNESGASSTITNAKLKPKFSYANDDNIQAGQVISQDPAAGSTVDQGSDVKVTISMGKAVVTVPGNLTGQSYDTVRNILVGAPYNYNVIKKEEYNNKPSGTVISTNPPANSQTDVGITITVTVSIGLKPVPNVIGLSEDDASLKLEKEGFGVYIDKSTTAGEEYSSSVAKGEVIRSNNVSNQSPAAGSTNYSGTTVTIIVPVIKSKGPVPSVYGVSISPPSGSTVNAGSQMKFSAFVDGTEGISQDVTWSINGHSAGTTINQNGLLTVSENETSTTIDITATSTYDSKVSMLITINVNPKPAPAPPDPPDSSGGEGGEGSSSGAFSTD